MKKFIVLAIIGLFFVSSNGYSQITIVRNDKLDNESTISSTATDALVYAFSVNSKQDIIIDDLGFTAFNTYEGTELNGVANLYQDGVLLQQMPLMKILKYECSFTNLHVASDTTLNFEVRVKFIDTAITSGTIQFCLSHIYVQNAITGIEINDCVKPVGAILNFIDTNRHYYSEEVQKAYDYAYGMGITTAPSIDYVDVYNPIIKSHMAKMIVTYAKEVKGLKVDTSVQVNCTDIADQSDELQSYIKEAIQMGLFTTDQDGHFHPNGAVTRAQFGTALDRILNGNAHEGSIPYYAAHLQALEDMGITNNTIDPQGLETRASVWLLLFRASKIKTDGINNIIAPKSGVYPNPARDYISIVSAKNNHQIFNLSGQCVLHTTQSQKIDISNLQPGLYVIQGVGRFIKK